MSIEQFKGQVLDLSRPNRFRVDGLRLGRQISFLAKASSLPNATLGVMPVPYMGREIKYAGDRTYEDWEITVYQANDADIRKRIDAWMVQALGHESNIGATGWNEYKSDLTVGQLDRRDRPIIVYRLVGCFPIAISPLELDWGTNDTPADFNVTFAYDYYEIVF